MSALIQRRRQKKPVEKSQPARENTREWPKHRKFIRTFACPACVQEGDISAPAGDPRRRIECAHVRIGTDGGTSLKPSDFWTIPLCEHHHRESHQIGEPEFQIRYGLKLKALALKYAALSSDAGMKAAARAAGVL